ncbi:hypothetical protein ACFLSK_00095 [Chloroflexota bacterium]
MKSRIFQVVLIGRIAIALAIALGMVSVIPNSASAQSLGEYFEIGYNVEFNKTQIKGSEVFYATVEAEANCTENLPWPFSLASEAEITGNIIAEHQTSGARVTLNSGYTVTITDFPKKAGDITQESQSVPLQFPQGSQSGTYSIIAELIQARVKAISIWWPVTDYLPSSQPAAGSITYATTGGGGGGLLPTATKVNLSGLSATTSLRVNSSGVVQETCRLQYLSGKAYLDIAEGTKLLDAHGIALTSLSANEAGALPAPSSGIAIVSAVDFGPDGTSFKPAITLTMNYNSESLTDGITEDELYIAYWDSSQWQALPSVLDTEANMVSTQLSHFTQFAIAGKLPAEQTSTITPTVEPPEFTISALSITPTEVAVAQKVTVSAMVANTGGSRGKYTIILKVNGIEESGKQLIFDAGAGQEVSFDIVKNFAGTYEVGINGLVGSFVVKETTVELVEPSSEIPLLTELLKSFNWRLIGSVIAGIVIIGLVMYYFIKRRARK